MSLPSVTTWLILVETERFFVQHQSVRFCCIICRFSPSWNPSWKEWLQIRDGLLDRRFSPDSWSTIGRLWLDQWRCTAKRMENSQSEFKFHHRSQECVHFDIHILIRFLEKNLPLLRENYWPTLWCFEARFQTIFASILRSAIPDIQYRRQVRN